MFQDPSLLDLKLLLRRRRELLELRSPIDKEMEAIEQRIALFEQVLVLPAPVAAAAAAARPAPPKNRQNLYLLWAIRNGKLDYGACAADFFGEDTPRNRQRLHRALFALQRAGKIRKVGREHRGRWEIRVHKRRGRPPRAK